MVINWSTAEAAAVAKRELELKMKARRLCVGYAVMDVLRLYQSGEAIFGQWNQRELIEANAVKMMESFMANGLQYL